MPERQDVFTSEIPRIETRTVTRNGTTYQQDTANIGRKPESFDGGTRQRAGEEGEGQAEGGGGGG